MTNQNVLPKIFCKYFENLGEIKKYEKKIHFDDCSFEFPTLREFLKVDESRRIFTRVSATVAHTF